MKSPKSPPPEAAQTPVFPKTLHRARLPVEPSKPAKRDNTFSKSRDVREDRGERQAKTANNAQSLPHNR
jgi:hypothetical protein